LWIKRLEFHKLFLILSSICLPIIDIIAISPFLNQSLKGKNELIAFPRVDSAKFLESHTITINRVENNEHSSNDTILILAKLVQKHPKTLHWHSFILVSEGLKERHIDIIFLYYLYILSLAIQIILQFHDKLSIGEINWFLTNSGRVILSCNKVKQIFSIIFD
jgi:hypothetical protein